MSILLEDLTDILKKNGKTLDDIVWIGCQDFYITKENFFELANAEYWARAYYTQTAIDLLIVGDDWWIKRECDSEDREWFVFNKYPVKPYKCKKIRTLACDEEVARIQKAKCRQYYAPRLEDMLFYK